MPKASVKRLIECKKKDLIDLVLDIEKYPEFVPFCYHAKVYENNKFSAWGTLMKNKIKLKKGDEVIVLTGKDKGKTGKIVRVIPDIRKVIVADVNKYKKHQKPGNNEPGGIIEKDMPLHVSNVAFYDPSSKKGIRVGYIFNKDGKKMRINKKSGKEI